MRSIRPEPGAWRRAFVPIVVLVAALFALLPAAALAADPIDINWDAAASTYTAAGGTATAFVASPIPSIGGMTAGPDPAYGIGGWFTADTGNEAYIFSFANAPEEPTWDNSDLAGKDIDTGTQLELRFNKTAGQRIDYFAVICATDAPVIVKPPDGKTLTEASYFIVKATIVHPVKSASGELAGGAFGFGASAPSGSEETSLMGAIFATDMHWWDIDTTKYVTTADQFGLSAAGSPDVLATFVGIFPPGLLAKMGIEPANVQGFIDTRVINSMTLTATFEDKGAGDGTLWADGWYKYRVTNSSWSSHDIMYGTVTPTVTLKLSGLTSGAMKLGKSLTAKGKVTPSSLAGSKVTLTAQLKKGAKWVKAKTASATISPTGAYSWKYKPAKRGAYRLRATIAKSAAHAAATTKWRPFKVK